MEARQFILKRQEQAINILENAQADIVRNYIKKKLQT